MVRKMSRRGVILRSVPRSGSGEGRSVHIWPVPSASLMAVDPVCGTPVNPHTAYWMIWYKGTPYYFCGEDCQMKFDRKPEHYRQLVLERRQNEAVY
jgi:YHS domain-containing protein